MEELKKGWLHQQKAKLEQRILDIEMETVLGTVEMNSEADYDKAVKNTDALMAERKACKEALARIESLLKSK